MRLFPSFALFLNKTKIASRPLILSFNFDVSVFSLSIGPELFHDDKILIEIDLIMTFKLSF